MARLNQGPNGPFSGKVGSIIGSSWKGIYYIKGLQKKINKPRSPLQLEQQRKFGLAVRFLSHIKPVVDMGFSLINPRAATGYNMAISYLLQNSIRGSYPDYEIDFSSVVFCTKGKLPTPETVTMELNGMSLRLDWSTDSSLKSHGTDKVQILIHQPGERDYQISPEGITRSNGGTEIELDSWYEGDTVHVYMFMTNYDRKKWSNSVYVGHVKFRD